MMNVRGLYTAIYQVADLAAAKAWYAQAFGVAPYFDEPFYVGFNVAGYELGLLPATDADEGGSTGVVAYWGVDAIDPAYAGMLEAGATAYAEPQDVGGGIRVATVRDPSGNVIGLIENPHFGAGA